MSTSVKPTLMWQQPENCPYSTLFFSGLRAITSTNGRPSSMIAGLSTTSPVDVESPTPRRGHSRNASLPHHHYPKTAYPDFLSDAQSMDRPMRRPSGPRATVSKQHETRNPTSRAPGSRDRGDSFASSSSDSYLFHEIDSDTESLSSVHTQRYAASPLTSFLSFNVSPMESSVNLVPNRERRMSTQTMPLPPRESRERKRRSVVSAVDLYLNDPDGRGEHSSSTSPSVPLRFLDDVGEWGEDVLGDWRQRTDSPFQDDRSFLITSH